MSEEDEEQDEEREEIAGDKEGVERKAWDAVVSKKKLIWQKMGDVD